MGNCQAIENATVEIQHPFGRIEKHYWPISAAEIMKNNPGYYVALLLTTTTTLKNNSSVRITRIKLLKPTDTLLLGHVYRLITTQEVMKGFWAKKHSAMKQQLQSSSVGPVKSTSDSYRGSVATQQVIKQEKHRSRNSAAGRCKAWQPSLLSISEAASAGSLF